MACVETLEGVYIPFQTDRAQRARVGCMRLESDFSMLGWMNGLIERRTMPLRLSDELSNKNLSSI